MRWWMVLGRWRGQLRAESRAEVDVLLLGLGLHLCRLPIHRRPPATSGWGRALFLPPPLLRFRRRGITAVPRRDINSLSLSAISISCFCDNAICRESSSALTWS